MIVDVIKAVVERSPHDRMAGRHYGMMSQVLSLLFVDVNVFIERRGPICCDVAAQFVDDRLFVVAAGFYVGAATGFRRHSREDHALRIEA